MQKPQFTVEELVFMQRLIGHHTTCNLSPKGLYSKLVDYTDSIGKTGDPMSLKLSPHYDYPVLTVNS